MNESSNAESEGIAMAVSIAVPLGLALVYISTSLLLLRYPTILHKKKKVNFKATHISHRGGAGERIENTLAAFRNAYQVGTDMFELDCQVTKDGQVVISHDDDMSRICGVEGNISDTNYADLPPIRDTQNLTFMRHFNIHRPDTRSGQDSKSIEHSYTLLRDLFEEYPFFPVNLDPKNAKNVGPVLEIIRHYNKEKTIVWGSFGDDVNQKCYRLAPEIPLIIGLKPLVKIIILFYLGLLPFFPIKETYLEIPMLGRIIKHHDSSQSDRNTRAKWLKVLDWLMLSPCLFRHLQRRGMQVYAWVLNDEEDFDAAFEMGFDGVMTDFPSKLKAYLDKKQS